MPFCSYDGWPGEPVILIRNMQVHGPLLPAALVHNRQHFDFDQTIRMGQAPYLHGRTGRERAEILHPHVDMAEELVDIRDIGGRLHDIVQRRAGCSERGSDILADLTELDAHVTLADHVALGKRLRLDVLSLHGMPPSLSLFRPP